MKIQAHFRSIIFLIVFLLVSPLSFAAKDSKPPKLFDDPGVMNVTLTGPWKTVRKNIKDDVRYPVKLEYTGADGQRHTLDVEVAPRGITRRLRVCKFPPLKVHFDKDKTKGTEFRGNKSLKLVTYCQVNSKYEQYYIKEFLVYRIYNLLTDYSFRVRPLIVEYRDSQDDDDSITRFSFLIEDIDDVAERNDFKELSIARTAYTKLDPATTSTFSLFQFMIGNLDWSATGGPTEDSCCHNFRLIGESNESVPRYGVPYDFDSSGLVNAHYAAPPNALKMRNIRQRLYRGFCIFNDQLPESSRLLNERKADILALISNNSYLDDRYREDAISYIEDFYEILNDPKKFERLITDKCRG